MRQASVHYSTQHEDRLAALYASNRAAIRDAGIAELAIKVPLVPVPQPRARQPHLPAALKGATAEQPCAGACPVRLQSGTAVPLVCMLHGCTQTAAIFLAATRMNEAADRHGFVVVYPQQEREQNPQGCWNWFLAAPSLAAVASPRQSRRSCARSSVRRRSAPSTHAGSSSRGSRPAARWPPSSPRHIPTCSRLSRCTRASAYGSARSVNAAFAAMANGAADADREGAGMHAAMGAWARPVPSIVVHGSADRDGGADQRRAGAPAVDGRQPAGRSQALRTSTPRDRPRPRYLQAPGGLRYASRDGSSQAAV